MRIVITAAPRSGNHWLKCLLAEIYRLEVLQGGAKPATGKRDVKIRGGVPEMPDGTIFHQHRAYSREMVEAFLAMPARLVTIIRDPYDVFFSYHRWVQEPARLREGDLALRDRHAGHPRAALAERPLQDPSVLGYLETEFEKSLQRSVRWSQDPDVLVVRYEDLHAHARCTLTRLTDRIQPVSAGRIDDALASCAIDTMRAALPHTVKSGAVGGSRGRLGEEHLRIFRERHGDAIRALGYPVR